MLLNIYAYLPEMGGERDQKTFFTDANTVD
jgi:hypothetical protein